MKSDLRKATFIGDKENLVNLIELLKSSNSFQMIKYDKTIKQSEITDGNKLDALIAIKMKLDDAIKMISVVGGRTKINYETLLDYAKLQSDAMTFCDLLASLHAEINYVDEAVRRNLETIQDLRDYENLPYAFDMVQNTKSVVQICGIMPANKYNQFLRDFDTKKMGISQFPAPRGNVCVTLCVHRDDAPIAEAIYSYDFTTCKFNFKETAKAAIERLQAENAELNEKRGHLVEDSKLPTWKTDTIKHYYDYVCNEIDTLDLVVDTLQTQKYYVLNGWIVASREKLIRNTIEAHGYDVNMIVELPTRDDAVPVMIKSNPIVRPFHNITNMYGAPAARDIDPNPWVALFYFIFFGFMIGDIGYGIVLCLAVTAFIYFKKPESGTKQFLLLFGICSASSILWGLFFGSMFGFETGTGLVHPMEGAIYVLLISLLLGLIQMAVGVSLGAFVNFKNGRFKRAMLRDLPRVVLFIGLLMFLPKVAYQIFGLSPIPTLFNSLFPIGMWITIVGAAGTAMTNPYSLISYFNDTVSYVRLFALSLVGTVIATIGNTVGEMLFTSIPVIGVLLGILITVAFHVFNLGLGLLGAYIHGARLQFIEFFSKFYSGEGLAFSPIGGTMKYSYIMEHTKGGRKS